MVIFQNPGTPGQILKHQIIVVFISHLFWKRFEVSRTQSFSSQFTSDFSHRMFELAPFSTPKNVIFYMFLAKEAWVTWTFKLCCPGITMNQLKLWNLQKGHNPTYFVEIWQHISCRDVTNFSNNSFFLKHVKMQCRINHHKPSRFISFRSDVKRKLNKSDAVKSMGSLNICRDVMWRRDRSGF